MLTVAILGTDEFSVYDIDTSSIALEGVRPTLKDYEDVATPYQPNIENMGCPTEGPDGFQDLTMKFKTREIMEAVEAYLGRDAEDSEVVVLTL